MNIQLSEHFSYPKLLRFTLPSIVMMVFTSIYGVVDGYFVSNYVGKTAFTAVNFIMPFLLVLGAFGFMFGTGGSALVAKLMGEGEGHRANSLFSLIVYITVGIGLVLGLLGIILLRPIAHLLGAEGELLEQCVRYGRINLVTLAPLMLQYVFQSFFVVAEKPQLGLMMSLIAGVSNIILDALLVAVIPLGLEGAAWATSISQLLGGVAPLIYFASPENCRLRVSRSKTKTVDGVSVAWHRSTLRLTRTRFEGRALIKVCTNGSSELMSNISMSLVGMLYNAQLLKYASNDGVAAYGVLMYVNFVFLSAFIGYSVGAAPLVSYHYGAKNHDELRNLLRKSLILIAAFAGFMLLSSQLLALPLSRFFVGYDEGLLDMTLRGFRIFSFCFLFAGFAIYGSSFFTALNDGLTSALISFLRSLVFQLSAVMLLPLLLGLDGIWLSIVVADLLAATVTTLLWLKLQKKYGY